MSLWMWIAASFAGPLHTGVPVRGIPGLLEPNFQTSQTGWAATIAEQDGVIRVFVGQTEEEAAAWVVLMVEQFSRSVPAYTEPYDADEVHGDGVGVLVVRDRNIGLMVRVTTGAMDWMQTLRKHISDQSVPWPAPPVLENVGDRWVVSAPGAAHVSFQGGKFVPSKDGRLNFREPPTKLVAWDELGRAAVWEADPQPSVPANRHPD